MMRGPQALRRDRERQVRRDAGCPPALGLRRVPTGAAGVMAGCVGGQARPGWLTQPVVRLVPALVTPAQLLNQVQSFLAKLPRCAAAVLYCPLLSAHERALRLRSRCRTPDVVTPGVCGPEHCFAPPLHVETTSPTCNAPAHPDRGRERGLPRGNRCERLAPRHFVDCVTPGGPWWPPLNPPAQYLPASRRPPRATWRSP